MPSRRDPSADRSAIVRFEGTALGSPLRLQVHGAGRAAASSAWSCVLDEFAEVDLALSRHRDDSELTALNRSAGSGPERQVGRRLFTAIAATDRARRVTSGRFDARVLAELERLGDHGARLPTADRPTAPAGARRNPRRRSVILDRPHDLGGIGKGLALRWAARRIDRELGQAAGFLLEAGGDIVVRGRPVDEPVWSIAIEDPRLDGSTLAVIAVDRGAVCTSSVARRRWQSDGGRTVHHLIDPRTGEPGGGGLRAVTVAAGDPAWAEIWSKALFIEGQSDIGRLARVRGLAAWWVEADGVLAMTPAARVLTSWTRQEDAPAGGR